VRANGAAVLWKKARPSPHTMLSALRRGARQQVRSPRELCVTMPIALGESATDSSSFAVLQAWQQAAPALSRWLSSGTDLKARFAELLPAEQVRYPIALTCLDSVN